MNTNITALPDIMRYNYRGPDASDYGQDASTVRNSIHTLYTISPKNAMLYVGIFPTSNKVGHFSYQLSVIS